MSRATVFQYHGGFSSGRESEKWKTEPNAKTDENIARAMAVSNKHRRAAYRLMGGLTDNPKTIVQWNVRRKLCVRFVCHTLTMERRWQRVSCVIDSIEICKKYSNFFFKYLLQMMSPGILFENRTTKCTFENRWWPKKSWFKKSKIKSTFKILFFYWFPTDCAQIDFAQGKYSGKYCQCRIL